MCMCNSESSENCLPYKSQCFHSLERATLFLFLFLFFFKSAIYYTERVGRLW